LANFLRWQVSSRLATGPMVHGWINGARFLVRRGETGLTGNIYTGLHEFADMAFVLHFLRRDDLFLDVGANVGSYTLLACAARGARGLAFEPVPETFERLVDNLRLNRLEDRVQALNRGVGAEPGTLLFSAGQDTMNHALAPGEASEGAVSVDVVTLDDATRGLAPDLMKIDVEGFEWPAMQGAATLLSLPSLRAIIMELNGSGQRYGFDEALLLQLLLDRGFRTYTYDPVGRRLQDLGGKNLASGNTLFLRDVDFVARRLVDSEAFAVFGRRY
jgi:FkbM family methyltransferase